MNKDNKPIPKDKKAIVKDLKSNQKPVTKENKPITKDIKSVAKEKTTAPDVTVKDLQGVVQQYVTKICHKEGNSTTKEKDAAPKDHDLDISVPGASVDKCIMAFIGIMIKDWTQSNVAISIINSDKEYGLLIVDGKKLATEVFIDVNVVDIFPIDKSFRCDIAKSQAKQSESNMVPILVTAREICTDNLKPIKFQFSNSENALSFNTQIRRIVERLPIESIPANKAARLAFRQKEMVWLQKYAKMASQKKQRYLEFGVQGETEPQDQVEEYGMLFTDSTSFQRILSAPPSIGAMMLTSLVIANPLKKMEHSKSSKSSASVIHRAFTPADFIRKRNTRKFGGVNADVAVTWLNEVEHNLGGQEQMNPTDFYIRKKLIEREKEYCSCVSHTIFIASWNVHGGYSESVNFSGLLHTEGIKPDFYVIGLQEIVLESDNPDAAEKWLRTLECCSQFQETSYVRLSRANIMGILLVVYVKKDLFICINSSDIVASTLVLANDGENAGGVGFANLFADQDQKTQIGAVGIRLTLFHTSVCFVTCQLTPGENQAEKRNHDFNTILDHLVFENTTGDFYRVREHDVNYFFGDFSYQIFMLDTETVMQYIGNEEYDRLINFDELNREKLSRRAFADFIEGDILFGPTYKFLIGKEDYDVSVVPSYRDRILWSGKRCDNLNYRAHEDFCLSDHKPVTALFNVGFRRIEERLLHKTYEAVVMQMDLLLNLSLPHAEVNTNDVNLGQLRFLEPHEGVVVLRNTGQTPFKYNFADPECEIKMPRWLRIDPVSGSLHRGEKVSIVFQALVNGDTVAMFHQGSEQIDKTVVVLALLEGRHIFININGSFVPTTFGLPLSVLLGLQKPIREIPASEIKRLVKLSKPDSKKNDSEKRVPFTTVREVFRLIEHINNCGLNQPALFLQPGIQSEIQDIITALDTTAGKIPLPQTSIHSVIEVLLIFLNCLPDPVIPRNCAHDCIVAANDPFECTRIVQNLPVNHRNLFQYVINFLKKCLEHGQENGTETTLLSNVFGDILLRECPNSPPNVRELKIEFIKNQLESTDFITGTFVPPIN